MTGMTDVRNEHMSEQARRWLKPGAAVGTIHLAGPDSGCPHTGERRTVVIIGTGTHDGPAELCEQCQRLIPEAASHPDTDAAPLTHTVYQQRNCEHWVTEARTCEPHETCVDCGAHLPTGWADRDQE